MRVIVIGDMEGVSGITKWEQVEGGSPMFEEGRRLYTEEINAAVRGAFDGGATDVLVMDCHGAGKGWTFNSLIPEALDERCEWVVQSSWTGYTAFIEQGCDAALFVAMHAMAGSARGVMSHTVSGRAWHSLKFNGKAVGETGINAALCGHWGTPVLMVTGDDVTCEEARDLLGDGVVTVAVKEGLGRHSARHIPPVRARQMIQEAATRAVSNIQAVAPYDPGRPCSIEVEYATTEDPEAFLHRSGVEITDGRTIVSRADDWWSAWRQFYFPEI